MVDNSKVFNRLNSKIDYLRRKFPNDLVKNIVNDGTQRLKTEYSFNLSIQGIDVDGIVFDNRGRIYAEGKEVAFEEFGTGKVGEQSNYPKELLPKQKITFMLANHQQVTNGWEYYYIPKPNITKKQYNGEYGWFYKKQFTKGIPAGKQVYTTAIYLKNNLSNIAKKTIRENT